MAFPVSARTAADDPRAPEVPAARVPGQPGPLARYEGVLVGAGAVVAFLAVWQLVALRRLVPELFLPGPTDILNAFVAYVQKGQIWPDMWISGQELMYGFFLSIAIGLPIGVLMGWYKRLHQALDPFVTFFYSIPRVALTPLLIIWFGIGINSKIAIIFLSGVFYPLMYARVGVSTVDSNILKCAKSFGANDFQLLRTVVLPSSVPYLMTGARLGLGRALVGVVVGELYAATAGIGYLITVAGATFQTDKVFVGVLLITFAGVFFTAMLQRVEERFSTWRPRLDEDQGGG
jgi:ABC-type nitrate/sulfonate/bicarbonate transport system permease component